MENIEIPESDGASRMELRTLFLYIWQGRHIVLATVCLFVVIGILWFVTAPRIYQASALLSAAPGSSSNSAGGGASALSGAARLIGLAAPSGSSGVEYTKFQSLLTSNILADQLATKTDLLQRMYPDRWDQKTRTWSAPSGFVASIRSAIRSILGRPPQQAPGVKDIVALLNNNVREDLSLQTGLLELTATGKDPEFTRLLLTDLHRGADNILRASARMRSKRRIEYLSNTLKLVEAVEQRAALIQLLSQEEQTSMMIESDPNYAADLVDPPHVLPEPISPRFVLTLILSIFSGVFVGIIIYIVLRALDLHTAVLEWRPRRWRNVEARPERSVAL